MFGIFKKDYYKSDLEIRLEHAPELMRQEEEYRQRALREAIAAYPANVSPIIDYITNNEVESTSRTPVIASQFHAAYGGESFYVLKFKNLIIEMVIFPKFYGKDIIETEFKFYDMTYSPQLDLFEQVPDKFYIGSIRSSEVHPLLVTELKDLMINIINAEIDRDRKTQINTILSKFS